MGYICSVVLSVVTTLIHICDGREERENIIFGLLGRELKDQEMQPLTKSEKISKFDRSLAKSLLKYYCSDRVAFEEFEKALFYPAIKAHKPIQKWTTFRGMPVIYEMWITHSFYHNYMLDLHKIPHTFLRQVVPFFRANDYSAAKLLWTNFQKFFADGESTGSLLIQALKNNDINGLVQDYWPKLDAVRVIFVSEKCRISS